MERLLKRQRHCQVRMRELVITELHSSLIFCHSYLINGKENLGLFTSVRKVPSKQFIGPKTWIGDGETIISNGLNS